MNIFGNRFALNFSLSISDSLFKGSDDFGFIKDLTVAGTTNNHPLYMESMSNSYNIRTFGTVIVTRANYGTRIPNIGTVANAIEAENTSLTISNYASFCVKDIGYQDGTKEIVFHDGTKAKKITDGSLFGISPKINNAATGSQISNLGTIIGLDGVHAFNVSVLWIFKGYPYGETGTAGQSVYAISATNIPSANNYGIVMAGQGSNGYRGTDGSSGVDTDDCSAPTEGKSGGTGGENGAPGVAYMPKKEEIKAAINKNGVEIKDENGKGTGEYRALDGNTGWDGLDLHKYESGRWKVKAMLASNEIFKLWNGRSIYLQCRGYKQASNVGVNGNTEKLQIALYDSNIEFRYCANTTGYIRYPEITEAKGPGYNTFMREFNGDGKNSGQDGIMKSDGAYFEDNGYYYLINYYWSNAYLTTAEYDLLNHEDRGIELALYLVPKWTVVQGQKVIDSSKQSKITEVNV